MGLTNAQVVEKFINGINNKRGRMHVSAYNTSETLYTTDKGNTRDLFSYNTLLATYDVENNMVLLADNGLTPTTSKHRQDLLSALYNTNIKSYQVPMRMNQSSIPTIKDLIVRFEARMDKLSLGTDLALADNRHDFIRNYNLYKELIDGTGIKSDNQAKYDDIMSKVENPDYIKALQRERRIFLSNKNRVYAETIKDKQYFNE